MFNQYGEHPNPKVKQTKVVTFESYAEIETHFTRDDVRQLWRGLTDIDGIGEARATNLIVISGATGLTDIQGETDDDNWEYIRFEFGSE